MIRPEEAPKVRIEPHQIPDAVVEAAAELFADAAAYRDIAYEKEVLDIARRTVAAALNAWPGAAVCHYTIADLEGWEMVLPLPQEAADG